MRPLVLLAFLMLLPGAVAAEEEASWLPVLEPSSRARVQRRYVTKVDELRIDVGGEWLARGDYYLSPGVQATVAYWFREAWAAEVSGAFYFSSMNAAATELRLRTGRVPDSRRPEGMVRLGVRSSFGYGKLLVRGRVIHVEPQAFARLALLVSERSPSPGLDVGAGLLVHLLPWLHARIDVSVFPHMEKRSEWSFVTGVIPSLSVGVGASP